VVHLICRSFEWRNLDLAAGGTISVRLIDIIVTIRQEENSMANATVIQLAVLSFLAVTLLCLISVRMKRNARRARPNNVVQAQFVAEKVNGRLELEVEPLPPQTITIELQSTVSRESKPAGIAPSILLPMEPTAVPAAISAAIKDVPPVFAEQNPNQKILAGISENIRRSLIKPVPTYSPLQFPEKPRDTEYVRIKKKIITPHGQVRFSILKDSISANMLAVFRRACLEWKSPEDLISFLPPYLEPEAEILNGRLLLIGTPGHEEKLAIPIRSVDAESGFLDCFDFVSDAREATNTPAVVLSSDDAFKVVSRGVITQPTFVDSAERLHAAG
jgi:hypothetical protein